MSESELIEKGPCDKCGSSDACAVYTDGHKFCYSCDTYFHPDGSDGSSAGPRKARPEDLIDGSVTDLRARKLNQETCGKWRYETGSFKGQPVHVVNYCDKDGHVVAQKLRFQDKSSMPWLGNKKEAAPLYGQWLWKNGGKQVIVTEGELDALSVSQVFGNKWAVVSVSGGAAGAHRDVEKGIDFLTKFDRVVFMFDMDEPGQDAARRCASILPPGKAHIASLPLKDASDMLMAGRVKEINDACWNAREYRPDGIVSVGDVRDKAITPSVMGRKYFVPGMTEATFGIHDGYVIMIGAGTGVGKTDALSEQIAMQLDEEEEPIGTIFLETPAPDLVKRIAGKRKSKMFHIADGSWTQDELEEAVDEISSTNRLYLYDSFGSADWNQIRSVITHFAVGYKCKHIYLDHLTALAAMEDDEKKAIEQIMAELSGIAQQYGVVLWVVSHLATPEGKPHEEGGRVTIRHFKGSRAIGFWSHVMIGLERNQQDDDEYERTVTTFRILKYRDYGRAVGQTFRMAYDLETGRLHPAPAKDEAKQHGFTTDGPPISTEDF